MSSSAWDVVRITTGMTRSPGSSFSSASTSRPSLRGRLRSSRIRPGRGAPAYSPVRCRNCNASSPSFTTCNWLRILWCSNASRVISTSPGSSSTSSTLTTLPPPSVTGMLVLRKRWQGKPETGPGRDRRVEPDPAAVILDDLPYHGQAYPGSRIGRLVVQPLENHEYPLGVFRLDTDSIVAEREQPELAVPADRDGDPGRLVRAELQRVVDQVLEHGGQQRGLAEHHQQFAHLDRRLRAPYVDREVRPCLGEQHRTRHRLTALRGPPHPAEREQIVDQRLHPLGAVHRVLDVLVGLGIQPTRVAALQQLAEAGHFAQRLLEVVRGDVGELLQFGVGSLQVLGPGR